MSTPIMDNVVNINIPLITGQAGHYVFPSAVKSGGTAVDFTSGSWVYALGARPGQPAQWKGANPWSSGVTISGDASGIITVAWTAAATTDSGLNASSMTVTVIASNDSNTTFQQIANGRLSQAPYA